MSFGAIASLASSAIGGALGYRDSNNAAKAQRGYLDKALGKQDQALNAIIEGRRRATPYLDDLLEVSQSLEDDLLAQVDPVTARELRRIRQERQLQEANLTQNMAARGLDSFTTRMGGMNSIAGNAQNAITELGARMAAQRQSAIGQGRGAYMSALGQRGQYEQGVQGQIASNLSQTAGILGGVQVQAPNTAASIGALGSGFMDMYRTSGLEDALAQSGPSAADFHTTPGVNLNAISSWNS